MSIEHLTTYLEKYPSSIWTDHNPSDPGITLLESLHYVLTDLHYRLDFDIKDLLANGQERPYHSLYTPKTILHNQALSPQDYRKLLLDIKGVKNAWLQALNDTQPALYYQYNTAEQYAELRLTDPNPPNEEEASPNRVSLRGLYQVTVAPQNARLGLPENELTEEEGAEKEQLLQKIQQVLHQNRNLCEDFARVDFLPPQYFGIKAEVEVGNISNTATVLAAIYQRLNDYFSPPIRFYSLAEMLEKGYRMEEIFDGPILQHGFLPQEALLQRRRSIRASDLLQEIMKVEGVLAVRELIISSGEESDSWEFRLSENEAGILPVPILTLPDASAGEAPIQLYKGGAQLAVDQQRLAGELQNIHPTNIRPVLSAADKDKVTPVGNDRQTDQYLSVTHELPAVYGVGPLGPMAAPGELQATTRQLAQTKQLKAYLLFFDQLLAQAFSQLGHLHDLFAFQDNATYFSQIPHSVPLLEEILRQSIDLHRQTVAALTESEGLRLQRKNRLLNHLLARFGEDLSDYGLVQTGLQSDVNELATQLIQDKLYLLQNYPALSASRGQAFDYKQPNVVPSPYQQRLEALLGFETEGQDKLYIVEHILLRPLATEVGDAPPEVYLSQIGQADPYSLQLTVVLPISAPKLQEAIFQNYAKQLILQETPAHLQVHFLELEETAFSQFEAVYNTFLQNISGDWDAAFLQSRNNLLQVLVKTDEEGTLTQPIIGLPLPATENNLNEGANAGNSMSPSTDQSSDSAETEAPVAPPSVIPTEIEAARAQEFIPYDTAGIIILSNPQPGLIYHLIKATTLEAVGMPMTAETSGKLQLSTGQLRKTADFYVVATHLDTAENYQYPDKIRIRVRANRNNN